MFYFIPFPVPNRAENGLFRSNFRRASEVGRAVDQGTNGRPRRCVGRTPEAQPAAPSFVSPDGYERITNAVTNGGTIDTPPPTPQKRPYFARTCYVGPVPHAGAERPGKRQKPTPSRRTVGRPVPEDPRNAGSTAAGSIHGRPEPIPPKGPKNWPRVETVGGEV